jgi:hypothetical protein
MSRLCRVNLFDYGFGASSLRAEKDLDRSVFGKGDINGICRLEGNQQSEERIAKGLFFLFSTPTTTQNSRKKTIKDCQLK